jgi:hypothetical protein
MSEVKRYVLRVGHSDDAGLGGEGWLVRMSDHFSSCEPAQQYVKAEDYDAVLKDAQRYRKLRAVECPLNTPYWGTQLDELLDKLP